MRVRVHGNKPEKEIHTEYQEADSAIKIGAWRDGGFGDAFYAYSVLKAIKEAYPVSEIEFISPHDTFRQVFHNPGFFGFSNKGYGEIHWINANPLQDYDMWFCLRPMTYSAARPQLYSNKIYSVSLERQIALHGDAFLTNPREGEHRMYGGGRLPAIDVYNHCLNLDADFYDSIDVIRNHPDYKSYDNPFKGDYITMHQWGYTKNDYNTKFWQYEYWRELAERIQSEYGLRIIQLGAPGEIPMDGVIENRLGQTNFFNSCRIIEDAKLHIDIEGSMVHAAALVKAKTLCLAGPSMEYWRHLDSPDITYLVNEGSCPLMPCEANTHGWHWRCCLEHHNCMNGLSSDRVFEEAKRILNEQS